MPLYINRGLRDILESVLKSTWGVTCHVVARGLMTHQPLSKP